MREWRDRMFFNSSSFKMLENTVDVSWMKQQVHTQNLANIDTPGYKASSLNFKYVFDDVNSSESPQLSHVDVSITENDDISILQDGNNVDLEKENIELYKAYVQYSLSLDKVAGQFTKYSYVLNSGMK